MNNLIRRIREQLSLSQSETAQLLNVSFATVNRWENGHSEPGRAAQAALFDLCEKRNVDVYSMTLDRIAASCGNQPNRITLYHGSKSGIDGVIRPISRPQCDFGRGFYMGTDPAQALTLVCDYDDSKFYAVSLDASDLKTIEVPADIDWAMLVAYNRGKMESVRGTPLYEKYRRMTTDYDVIVGCIADDRMFYVIDNFFIGNITDAALVGSLSALRLGKQYVAVTQKACDAVRIESEIKLSFLERLFVKKVAGENRAKGVSLANEICRRHRREGLFFDELLEKALEERS